MLPVSLLPRSCIGSDGTAICSFAFTRDANGNILTSQREDGSCWYYQYDGLQRLHKAEWKDSGGASLYATTYDYDRVGNRTHLAHDGQHTDTTYNPANELVQEHTLGAEEATYAYDGRGNQTRRTVLGGETQYYAYNSRNLLSRVTSTDPSFTPNTFEYNALDERVKITDSTGTTRYVWDGLNITHELDASGTLERRYTIGYSPTEGVAQLLDAQDFTSPGDPHFWPGFDQVGGSHVVTDATGTAARRTEFSPYGRLLSETGTAPSPFRFPGTYLDTPDLPGMPLSRTRQFVVTQGRFASRDRAVVVPSYGPLMTNPVAVTDASGAIGAQCHYTGEHRTVATTRERQLSTRLDEHYLSPVRIKMAVYTCKCKVYCCDYDLVMKGHALDEGLGGVTFSWQRDPKDDYVVWVTVDSYETHATYKDKLAEDKFCVSAISGGVYSALAKWSRSLEAQELAQTGDATGKDLMVMAGLEGADKWIGEKMGELLLHILREKGFITEEDAWGADQKAKLRRFTDKCKEACQATEGKGW